VNAEAPRSRWLCSATLLSAVRQDLDLSRCLCLQRARVQHAAHGFEAYLDQINAASGSGDTLADSYASDIKVSAPSGSKTGSDILIGVGAFVVVLAIVAVLLWRRRKGHPHTPNSAPRTS
jgi:hypothetical protein